MPSRAYAWSAALALVVAVAVINSHRRGHPIPAATAAVTPAAVTYAPTTGDLGCAGPAALRPDGVVSLSLGTDARQRPAERTVAAWHCSDSAGRHPSLVQVLLGAPGDPYRPQRTILPTSAGMTVLRMQVRGNVLALTLVTAAQTPPARQWQWLGTAWKLSYRFDIRDPGMRPSAVRPSQLPPVQLPPVRLGAPCRAADLAVSAYVPWTPWDLWSATGDYDQDASSSQQGNAVQLRFVNHGPACVLTGYPSVVAGNATGSQRATQTLRGLFGGILSDPDPPVLLLEHHEPATAVLEWAPRLCGTTSTLSVTLPGERERTRVSWPVGTCGLQIHPVTLQLFEPTG